jgi:hypothetical protein
MKTRESRVWHMTKETWVYFQQQTVETRGLEWYTGCRVSRIVAPHARCNPKSPTNHPDLFQRLSFTRKMQSILIPSSRQRAWNTWYLGHTDCPWMCFPHQSLIFARAWEKNNTLKMWKGMNPKNTINTPVFSGLFSFRHTIFMKNPTREHILLIFFLFFNGIIINSFSYI